MDGQDGGQMSVNLAQLNRYYLAQGIECIEKTQQCNAGFLQIVSLLGTQLSFNRIRKLGMILYDIDKFNNHLCLMKVN